MPSITQVSKICLAGGILGGLVVMGQLWAPIVISGIYYFVICFIIPQVGLYVFLVNALPLTALGTKPLTFSILLLTSFPSIINELNNILKHVESKLVGGIFIIGLLSLFLNFQNISFEDITNFFSPLLLFLILLGLVQSIDDVTKIFYLMPAMGIIATIPRFFTHSINILGAMHGHLEYGIFALVCITYSFFLYRQERNHKLKIFLVIAMTILAVGWVTALAKTTYFMVVIITLTALFFRELRKKTIIITSGLLIAILILPILLPKSFFGLALDPSQTFTHAFYYDLSWTFDLLKHRSGSFGGRLVDTKAGFDFIINNPQSLVLGEGMGSYKYVITPYRSIVLWEGGGAIMNGFLAQMIQIGFLGFFLSVMLIIISISNQLSLLKVSRKMEDTQMVNMGFALFFHLEMILVFSTLNVLFIDYLLFVVFALTVKLKEFSALKSGYNTQELSPPVR